MKSSWMDDYYVGVSEIQEVTVSENIMNDKELHEIVEQEVAGVRVGASIDNTQELHTITFNEGMKSPDKDKCTEAIEEEFNKMNKCGVFNCWTGTAMNSVIEMGHEKEVEGHLQGKKDRKGL